MVNTKDLLFAENFMQFVIEGLRRGEIVTKWFLEHNFGVTNEVRLSEGDDDRGEERGGNLQVVQRTRATLQLLGQRLVRRGVREVTLQVLESLRKSIEDVDLHLRSGIVQRCSQRRA